MSEPDAAGANLCDFFPEITGVRRIVFNQQDANPLQIHRFSTCRQYRPANFTFPPEPDSTVIRVVYVPIFVFLSVCAV